MELKAASSLGRWGGDQETGVFFVFASVFFCGSGGSVFLWFSVFLCFCGPPRLCASVFLCSFLFPPPLFPALACM